MYAKKCHSSTNCDIKKRVLKMEQNEKKFENKRLNKLESFSVLIDSAELDKGIWAWSGNFVVRLKTGFYEDKPHLFVDLYYADKFYRIQKSKERKENESKGKSASEFIDKAVSKMKTQHGDN